MPLVDPLLAHCGRARGRVTSALTRLERGGSAVVVVTGPPGHGQHALLHWAADAAERRGLQVLTARATPAAATVPHALTGALLASRTTAADGLGAPMPVPGGGADQPMPVRGEGWDEPMPLPGNGRDESLSAPGGGPDELLAAALHARPTLVVVEDARHADPDSARLLAALADRPRGPVVVLMSTHGTPPRLPGALARMGGGGGATELVLPAVDERGAGAVGARRCGGAPADHPVAQGAAEGPRGTPPV
ncbi:ATP-binding protein, partial [Streptomyces sp. NPDC037389]|uniref:ATP-binding protein n=1 Tax=Streptomyces sp. NPDC037389 TaxID=3155369 RepID=UPI0033EE733B